MRCAQCDAHVEEDDAVMVRGTMICPACARTGRQFGRTFLWIWLAFAVVVVGLPIALIGAIFLGCCGLSMFGEAN